MKRKPARNPEIYRNVKRIQRVIDRVNELADIDLEFADQKRQQITDILFSMMAEIEATK